LDGIEKDCVDMLNIKNLTISNAEKSLFSGMSLVVDEGEVVTLTGVSGSGKSTLLNWMIGDLDPSFSASGELWLNSLRCDTLPIEARHIGLLFQDDLLFPHLSVGQNLAFALPAKFRDAKARRQRVEQTLTDIGLVGFHDRDPATLSGGQRALLLDEPFSKLDAVLRTQFRAFVFEQIARQKIPTLLVTHDPADVPQGGRAIEISDC
jgi:putative thiamine transport system ATP-binding protein